MKKFILMLSIIATGCAGIQPTAKELAEADYGEEIRCPGEVVCGEAEGAAVGNLFDPYSAKVVLLINKGYVVSDSKFIYGYNINAMINAKNLHGGYVGNQVIKVFFVRRENNHYIICYPSKPCEQR